MDNALNFLEEKYGSNSWSNYPPSKRQVAEWLVEYSDRVKYSPKFKVGDIVCRKSRYSEYALTLEIKQVSRNSLGFKYTSTNGVVYYEHELKML